MRHGESYRSDIPCSTFKSLKTKMYGSLMLDLIHLDQSCAGLCLEKSFSDMLTFCGGDANAHVFLLRGSNGKLLSSLSERLTRNRGGTVHVLDSGSVSECLYRFKQTADELDINSVAVVTSARGRETLSWYQEQLFTAVYAFEYLVRSGEPHPDCRCRSPDPVLAEHHRVSADSVRAEVSAFLQRLPALHGEVTILRSTIIPECFGHGFSTRTGGISDIQTLSSLNLFSSSKRRDPKTVVDENCRRLALRAGFHPQPLRFVKVNHGCDVWVIGMVEPQSYDAIVTNQTGVVIAAPGADCMPLLFADPVSKVIGVAHAGWKGTLMGVAMVTVSAMVREFGCRLGDIVVVTGPSVGACCFTLERGQALAFQSIHPGCVSDPHSARPHINLRFATRILLQRGGILPKHIHDDSAADRPCVTPCTSCHPEAFFSHVRDGLNFGTQAGFLWIPETEELRLLPAS